MPTLQSEIVADLIEIENELNNASFVWSIDGNSYSACASVADLEKELEFGGFKTIKLLTLTVRLIDGNGYNVFTNNAYPQPQDIITYSVDNLNYRVISVKKHSTGAFIRLTCEGTTRGV